MTFSEGPGSLRGLFRPRLLRLCQLPRRQAFSWSSFPITELLLRGKLPVWNVCQAPVQESGEGNGEGGSSCQGAQRSSRPVFPGLLLPDSGLWRFSERALGLCCPLHHLCRGVWLEGLLKDAALLRPRSLCPMPVQAPRFGMACGSPAGLPSALCCLPPACTPGSPFPLPSRLSELTNCDLHLPQRRKAARQPPGGTGSPRVQLDLPWRQQAVAFHFVQSSSGQGGR